jgi:hypothetical protein
MLFVVASPPPRPCGVSQIGRRTIRAPAALMNFYSAMSVFELDNGAVLHPACYSSSPFSPYANQFVGSALLLTFTVVLFTSSLWKARAERLAQSALAWKPVSGVVARVPPAVRQHVRQRVHLAALQRVVLTLLVMQYAIIARSTLTMMHCVRDDNGVAVVFVNPRYRCYEGEHQGLGVVAWLLFFLHVVAFPLFTLLHVRNRARAPQVPAQWLAAWAPFIDDDFKPRMFWFQHVRLATRFMLAVLLVFGNTASLGAQGGVFFGTLVVVVANVGLMWWLKPFAPRHAWKMVVESAVMIVCLFGAMLNLVWYAALSGRISTGLGGSRSDSAAVVGAMGFSVFVFVLCVLLLLLFIAAFAWMIVFPPGGTYDKSAAAPAVVGGSATPADITGGSDGGDGKATVPTKHAAGSSAMPSDDSTVVFTTNPLARASVRAVVAQREERAAMVPKSHTPPAWVVRLDRWRDR